MRQGIFLPESAFSADAVMVSIQPPPPPRVQAHASSSVPTLKIPNTGNYTIGCTEIQHTLIGLGSTALSAPVPYPVKATQISHKRPMKYFLKSDQIQSVCTNGHELLTGTDPVYIMPMLIQLCVNQRL